MSSAPIMLKVQVARLVEVMLARLCSSGYARELVVNGHCFGFPNKIDRGTTSGTLQ